MNRIVRFIKIIIIFNLLMSIAKNSRNFYVKPESAERKIYLTLKKSLQQPLNLF